MLRHISLLLLLAAVPTFAADLAPDGRRVAPVDQRIIEGGPAVPTRADTLFAYGGPGTLEGKFETAGGLPDRQDWTSLDVTGDPESFWRIDTYRADEFATARPVNHAWWCGETYIFLKIRGSEYWHDVWYDFGIEPAHAFDQS